MEMKRWLSRILLSILCLGMAAGCIESPADDPTVPGGVVFYTTVKDLTFYFLDEEGNGLVDVDNRSTWPLSYSRMVAHSDRSYAFAQVKSATDAAGRTVWQYNDLLNSIVYDPTEGLWGFQGYLWGLTPQPQYVTYIYRGDVVARLTVSYHYTTASDPQLSGGWAVEVTSITYDGPGVTGMEILKGNPNGKVFVRQSAQGDSVSLGKR